MSENKVGVDFIRGSIPHAGMEAHRIQEELGACKGFFVAGAEVITLLQSPKKVMGGGRLAPFISQHILGYLPKGF